MTKPARRARPVRRVFGLIAGMIACGDIAIAIAVPDNRLGIPSAPLDMRGPLLGYGAFLVATAIACIATSFRRGGAVDDLESADAPPVAIPVREGEERRVIHALRQNGWYVADDVVLPHVDIDHVCIGPAGVLAVQVMFTNRPDDRAKPAIRARIAAGELRKALAQRELYVDVVPAVLAFGPGLTEEPGGVKVVDSVAILFGDQAASWVHELSRRELLDDTLVRGIREIVGDLREAAPHAPAATEREPQLVS